MPLDPQVLAEFRARLKVSQDANRDAWPASRRLVTPGNIGATVAKLAASIQSSSLPALLRETLTRALSDGTAAHMRDLQGEVLRQLTGLSPTKAVRALCLLFGLAEKREAAHLSALTPAEVEQFVRRCRNPFDLLLEADVSSVLELGAGDLSFAAELVEQYLPLIKGRDKDLTMHCLDRLQPGSKLGGPLHADPDRLAGLKSNPSPHLDFRFWGNQDMFELAKVRGLWPRYTIVTCQAPPTPAFAYEPTRLSPVLIQEQLRKTKGEFRLIRKDGEEALEVQHAGRTLLFPPWKFEVRGPLALLDLLSRRGALGVLTAVDMEVFWELLSQLLADPRVRPRDVFFTPSLVAELFGEVGAALSVLPVGEAVVLSDIAELRAEIPAVMEESTRDRQRFRFRYVEIRRGALFAGVPASRTAKMFKDMIQEAPPWFLILVPELVVT
jgi:hypothetical protein